MVAFEFNIAVSLSLWQARDVWVGHFHGQGAKSGIPGAGW
jgi:hypothetical protein